MVMMLAGIGVGSLGSLKVELGALGFDEIKRSENCAKTSEEMEVPFDL